MTAASWAVTLVDLFDGASSGITVPFVAENPCGESHELGWACTRMEDHHGRHAAALSTGEVLAVWPTTPMEPTC